MRANTTKQYKMLTKSVKRSAVKKFYQLSRGEGECSRVLGRRVGWKVPFLILARDITSPLFACLVSHFVVVPAT